MYTSFVAIEGVDMLRNSVCFQRMDQARDAMPRFQWHFRRPVRLTFQSYTLLWV